MNGPHELTDVIFHTPLDAIVSPLRGKLSLRARINPQSRNLAMVFDSSSQLLSKA